MVSAGWYLAGRLRTIGNSAVRGMRDKTASTVPECTRHRVLFSLALGLVSTFSAPSPLLPLPRSLRPERLRLSFLGRSRGANRAGSTPGMRLRRVPFFFQQTAAVDRIPVREAGRRLVSTIKKIGVQGDYWR